jgi:hypothetical protein
MDAILAEFTALRSEIESRSRSQWAIYALNLTVNGAVWGAALSHKVDWRVILILAFLSPLFGVLWLDHAGTIRRIGEGYIDTHLRGLAVGIADRAVLDWERWRRATPGPLWMRLVYTVCQMTSFAGAPALALGVMWHFRHGVQTKQNYGFQGGDLGGYWRWFFWAGVAVVALHAIQWILTETLDGGFPEPQDQARRLAG